MDAFLEWKNISLTEEIGIISDIPRPSFQYKGNLFAPESQRTGNKQRQELDDEGRGEGNKGEGDKRTASG